MPEESIKKYQFASGWREFKRFAAHREFSISRNLLRTLNDEHSKTFVMRAPAGAAWSVESAPEWVTVTPSSGEGKMDVTITVNEKAAGKYKFKAVQGNSDATVGNVKKTEVLWESFGTDVAPNVGDLVTGVGYKNGYVYFSTPEVFGNGNASIAVRNSKDVILWSWHIWCSEEGWTDQVYPNNASTMMDRNLGATSATPGDVGAFGLLYQWGRKDPFMGCCSLTEDIPAASTGLWNIVPGGKTIDWVEENPTTYLTLSSGVGEWYTHSGVDYAFCWQENKKSLYDPCPYGYRVPKGGNDGFWATALGTSSETSAGTTWDSTNKGRHWTLADGVTTAWYPAAGGRNGYYGNVSVTDGYDRSFGNYWAVSVGSLRVMSFVQGYVDPCDVASSTYGRSVRCVRE